MRWAKLHGDEVLGLVRSSPDRGQAIAALTAAPYSFTAVVADHILDLPMGRVTARGLSDVEEELAALRAALDRPD